MYTKQVPATTGPLSLKSKVALVTGAGQRVGAAIAQRLGAEGMRVAVHYNASVDGAKATADAVRAAGGEAELFAADLFDRHSARSLVDAVVARFGQLDVLVASAANFERVAFAEIDDATWDRALALNVTAPTVLAHRAAPHLQRTHGSITLITCASVTAPYANYLPYVVSKGAAHQLMRALAIELAPHVRVNAVAPGTVLPPTSLDAAELDALARRTLVGHLGSAEDVAEAVTYLSRTRFVTGHEILVDGGAALSAR